MASQESQNRFLVSGPFDEDMPHYYVIVRDIDWYITNETLITTWLDNSTSPDDVDISGVVLTFKQDKDLTAFLLKWN